MSPDGTIRWIQRAGRNELLLLGNDVLAAHDFGVARHARSTGATIWTQRWGATGAHALAGHPGGNVLLGGSFGPTFNLGGGQPSHGANDAFLAMLNPLDGTPVWSHMVVGSQGVDRVDDICSTAAGDIFVTGIYEGSATPMPGEAKDQQRPFVARYRSTGERVWVRTLPERGNGASLLCGDPRALYVGAGGSIFKLLP